MSYDAKHKAAQQLLTRLNRNVVNVPKPTTPPNFRKYGKHLINLNFVSRVFFSTNTLGAKTVEICFQGTDVIVVLTGTDRKQFLIDINQIEEG